ncbi:Rid family hydrolase [Rhodobaculum claviforme]|uniref:RidA family protein n=1 Tax=Rhodobaculum claviforme TaxID=1549854 RepID=A0A934THX6_9RHOB|nr:Rid family hydrolase [Rhodobaculum claviforme]MBK5925896.1 hypothetical protein [Rhodobaculum claviforme]
MIRFDRIDRPAIHLGAACAQLMSSCLTAPDRSGDVADQTRQILAVIDGHLHEHAAGRAGLMMVQVWLADIRDFAGFRAAWNDWVDPDHPPALSVVQAAASRRDTLVEIRAYAAR